MQNLKRCLLVLIAFWRCAGAQAGYTHYFTWNQKPDEAALQQCIAEMRTVIEARQNILAGPEGTVHPR
jgi:hypothetical protein